MRILIIVLVVFLSSCSFNKCEIIHDKLDDCIIENSILRDTVEIQSDIIKTQQELINELRRAPEKCIQ